MAFADDWGGGGVKFCIRVQVRKSKGLVRSAAARGFPGIRESRLLGDESESWHNMAALGEKLEFDQREKNAKRRVVTPGSLGSRGGCPVKTAQMAY